ncbi:MAG: hypothetical protein K0S07_128 [Chlamydiales bacterium]|jgi:hypothetical protein|nr:hypothetical protein [Chlamydiales bacterium]
MKNRGNLIPIEVEFTEDKKYMRVKLTESLGRCINYPKKDLEMKDYQELIKNILFSGSGDSQRMWLDS